MNANGYIVSTDRDAAEAALGHAEGLRIALIAMMREVAGDKTGEAAYQEVAATLRIEADKRPAYRIRDQACKMELELLASTFAGPLAPADKEAEG